MREPEPSPASTRPPDVEEEPLLIDLTPVTDGCSAKGYQQLRKRLLGLENASRYMSLEVRGDIQDYGPYQSVLFHLRVPRGSYVSDPLLDWARRVHHGADRERPDTCRPRRDHWMRVASSCRRMASIGKTKHRRRVSMSMLIASTY